METSSQFSPAVKRARSPIEMMVDQACGYDPDAPLPPKVLLECPICQRTKLVEKDKSDPEGAVRIVYKCNTCEPPGAGFDSLRYFDKDGKEIDP